MTQIDLFSGVVKQSPKSADISPCGRYRYRLERWWGEGDPVVFVMLNPSTADAGKDDATIRRCVGFAESWGFSGLIVVNLFAWRATEPRNIPRYKATAIGPHGDAAIRAAVHRSSTVVCAWGAHGKLHGRGADVLDLLRQHCRPKMLRMTGTGQPCHPLYLPADLSPIDMPGCGVTP